MGFRITLGIVAPLVLCIGMSVRAGEKRPSRPNIVVLLADDLGYGELHPDAEPEVPTPHIDSIAEKGVRFTAAYVTASVCSPSRAGLMTGRFQTRFGYEGNAIGAANERPEVGLPRGERTVAEHLAEAGYATACIGKWHLGGTARRHPHRHGFDHFYGFMHEGHFYKPWPYEGMLTWLRRKTLPDGSRSGRWRDGDLILTAHMGYSEPDYNADNPIERNGQPVDESEYLTRAWTREALRFIEKSRNRPFFLYLAYNAVHSPMQAPKKLVANFDHIEDIHRRIFAAMLTSLDRSVGRILGRLRKLGLERRTLVFFLSDNGGPTKELTSRNHPLRGGKGQVYEGGIRVPFLVQWPERLPAGVVYSSPVSSLDIYPTAAAAAEADADADALDGVNLLPFLTGDDEPPMRTLFWKRGPRKALRRGPWKVLQPGSADQWELYNLAEDRAEEQDRSTSRPKKKRALIERWKRMNEEMAERRF